MYHIANDIRAKKSADLIIQGLEECPQEKPLDIIKVIDIYNIMSLERHSIVKRKSHL